MRPILIFLVIAGAGIIAWLVAARPDPAKKGDSSKAQAITVSKHSQPFNEQISVTLDNYNTLTEHFVNWDSAGAAIATDALIKDLNKTVLDELNDDSTIYLTAQSFIENAKGDAQTIVSEKGIRQQREAFNSLTDNLRQFLNTVKYDKEKLYLQECPMAFDDTKPGQWLSRSDSIRNPYLGLHDPQYGRGMLHCGETKATINHTGIK
jgi:hypothetical protein